MREVDEEVDEARVTPATKLMRDAARRSDLVTLLLSLGAAPNARDHSGATALHAAVQSSHPPLFGVVLERVSVGSSLSLFTCFFLGGFPAWTRLPRPQRS